MIEKAKKLMEPTVDGTSMAPPSETVCRKQRYSFHCCYSSIALSKTPFFNLQCNETLHVCKLHGKRKRLSQPIVGMLQTCNAMKRCVFASYTEIQLAFASNRSED